ncbi:hypothetical protein ABB37_09300 [Leptomonas pyrrhocoris]|uniref:Uncharacterized protein n=1 Tax=Leptomonas pyrrhocoris TaxID=157538 RepID=A0A0N0VD06_LEPPY|nr:hypothetical protein ABB37_09300 [Leptomonas pyrrhocoris]KPA74308.1 hypothetical protein ABB37_09300 [Leptomonas pyrrhocoris]|eukprot:XP_015652747.1 hypothetical protein ABB37_09300 [Leptomonas pyrrhocoris]
MFVRIRGKGACPENSQAAVMHIRGFRHTHTAAPPDSFYPLIAAPPPTTTTTATTSAAHHEGTSSSSTAPAATTVPLTIEMRPFRFALFPVGIHAAALTEAQARVAAAEADAASPVSFLDSEVARMVWKETWNLYDILYDEVPLLPWTEAPCESAAATALAVTVEDELRRLAETAGTVELSPLASLRATTDDFELASGRTGSHQVVVCPHYYAAAALPEETFTKIQKEAHPVAVASDDGGAVVVVLDLRDLPVSVAGGKAMVNIAWCTAFAAMQPNSVLLRCRAVVVRLPYAAVPTYTRAAENAAAGAAAPPTIANAFVEAVDFIGEHITAVRHAMAGELGSKSSAAQSPPIAMVGSAPEAMTACLRALMAPSPSSSSSPSSAAPAGVVVFYGDHLGLDTSGECGAAHELDARKAAEYASIGEASACVGTVETVPVPLKALLDGGEEPWDEYTLKERQRLNFCPCCGVCGNDEEEGDGADHGHGHGHLH